jgi:hypothetical protein
MAKKRKGMTLAEHHARLRAEGKWDEYVARKREQEAAVRRKLEEYARAEVPLVHDLRAAGLAIDSVLDLLNAKGCFYVAALPILLAHLQRPYPVAVRESIARALAVPESKFAWSVLTKQFQEEHERQVRDGLALAISNASDEDVIGDVIDLARDPRFGSSRVFFIGALARSRDSGARDTLFELASDPDVKKEVEIVLRRVKRTKH